MTEQVFQQTNEETDAESLELWRARAIAALPIIEAAIKMTVAPFNLIEKGRVLIPTADYEDLHKAVHAYLAKAKEEGGDRHV